MAKKGVQGAPVPSGKAKAAAIAVVLVLVCASLGALLLYRPGGGGGGRSKPPGPVENDTLATPDVYISEVLPAYAAAGSPFPFVEVRAGPEVRDLRDWKLTTYENDSYVFISLSVVSDPTYVAINLTPSGPGLSLGTSDELGLYDPQGRLVDFVRWGGGNNNTTRGVWPPAAPGPSPKPGESISRLDAGRFDPAAWSASPPSPGEPNILAVEMSGLQQVLWLRSGRNYEVSLDAGGLLSLPPGKPVARSRLAEAASHLEYALQQLRRLGNPLPARVTTKGTPVLEFWITNGSAYRGITEYSGRVSLDFGGNTHVNGYLCAREMASLIELARWGAPNERNQFLRNGLATLEGLRTAASEISPSLPSIDGLWNDMKSSQLYNPFDNGRDLSVPFIHPWSFDADRLVHSWLFLDYCERKFAESGLGSSLSQALLSSSKDPLTALTEQLGRNLTALYWDWLVWRTAPGFRYPAPQSQWTGEFGPRLLEGSGIVPSWTAWTGRFNISFSGSAELGLSAEVSSFGPLQFSLLSARTGSLVSRNAVQPGQTVPAVVPEVRPLDELVLVVGSGEAQGSMRYRALPLPPAPSGLGPRDGSYTNQSRPLLGWSSVEGVASYEVQLAWNRTFLSLELKGESAVNSFQPPANLTDGRHYWRVRGVTPLGSLTEWSAVQNLTVDTVPPFAAPSVGEPRYRASPDDVWNISTRTQIGFTHEPSETVFFRFNATEAWQNFSTSFVIGGEDGQMTLQYYSRDPAGNVQPVQRLDLHIDIQPPELAVDFSQPSYAAGPGDIFNVTTATMISLTASDNWSGVAELKYRLDAQAWKNYAGEFNLSGLVEGVHILTITSADRLGNSAQLVTRFFIDLAPPAFTIQNLNNGTLLFGSHRTWINGSDHCGIDHVSYSVDGVAQFTSYIPPFEWLWDTSQLSDDYHRVEVRVWDMVGNVATGGVTVATENAPPMTTLSIGKPKYRAFQGDPWNVTSNSLFNLTATQSGQWEIISWYTIDGAYQEGGSFRLLGLFDGLHNITYGSRGQSGVNETAKCITVRLDNTPPAPLITSPIMSEMINATVWINASESSGAIDVCNSTFYWSLDMANWNFIGVDDNGADGWGVTWDTTAVSNGNYWIQAEMSDYLGNKATNLIMVDIQNH